MAPYSDHGCRRTALASFVTVALTLGAVAWPRPARADLVPPWDPYAFDMLMTPAPVPRGPKTGGVPYFKRTIPQQVHQVWLGDMGRWFEGDHRKEHESTTMWRSYAKHFQLGYTLWTDADVPELRSMMDPHLRRLFDRALDTGQYTMASDIARVVIIAELGGMYFDCDIQPPRDAGGVVPLGQVFPDHGLVLTTERFARSVGNTGIFVANGLLMAAPGHPVMRHLVGHLAAHAWHWAEMHGGFESMYMVGCVPLNLSLAGSFSIVALDDLYALGVIHEVSPNWVAAPE